MIEVIHYANSQKKEKHKRQRLKTQWASSNDKQIDSNQPFHEAKERGVREGKPICKSP